MISGGRPESPGSKRSQGISPIADANGSGELSLLSPEIPQSNGISVELMAASRQEEKPTNGPGSLFASLVTEVDKKNTPRTQSLRNLRSKDERQKNFEISTLNNDPVAEEQLGSLTSISRLPGMGSVGSVHTLGSPNAPSSQRSSLSSQGASMGSLPNFAKGINARKRVIDGGSIPAFRTSIEDLKNMRKTIGTPAETLGLDEGSLHNVPKNDFTEICEELASNYGSFQSALIQLMTWKDEFLGSSNSPINVKLSLVMLLSQLFRSKSDLQEPIFTLIKQIKMFSQPWHDKRFAIVKLESDYQKIMMALDIAIKKLEHMKGEKDKLKANIATMRWDKITRKLLVRQYSKFFSKWMLITQIQTRKIRERPKDTLPKVGEEDPVLVDDAAKRRRELSDDEDDEQLKRFLVVSRSKSRAGDTNIVGKKEPVKAFPFTAFEDRNVIAFDKYMLTDGLDIRSHLDHIEGIARDSIHRQKKDPYVTETSVRFSKISEISREQKINGFLDWCASKASSNPSPPRRYPPRGKKKDANVGKAPKMPVKKSYSMIQFPLFSEEDQQKLVSRDMVRSNSTNAICNLDQLEWIRPFDQNDFDFDDTFMFDRFAEDEKRAKGTSLDDIELEKPPDYLKFDKIIKETESSFLGTLDPQNTWFSLQDVLELTILHAQQVQVLHNSFTDQINDLNNNVEELKMRNRRLEESIKPVPPKFDVATLTDPVEVKQPKTHEKRSDSPARAPSRHSRLPLVETAIQTDLLMSEIEDKSSALRRKLLQREPTLLATAAARRQGSQSAKPKKVIVNDFAFAKSFLARLERFTQEKIRKQELRVKTIKEKEQEQLERTFVRTDKSPVPPVITSEMQAEFMPPMIPPSPKVSPLPHRIYHQFHRYQPKEDENSFLAVHDQRVDALSSDDDRIRTEEQDQSSEYSSSSQDEDGDDDEERD